MGLRGSQFNTLVPLAIGVVAVVVRVGFWWSAPHTWEDALITLRYAENLAAGNGFVFNAGERVLGTTTPLYTLTLAFWQWMGAAPLALGKVTNVVAEGVTSGLVTALFLRHRMRVAAVAAGLAYAMSAPNVKWSVSGMETGLYILAIMVAIFCWRSHRSLSILSAVAATLIRPDGILLLPALLLGDWDMKLPRKSIALGASVAVAWVGFAIWYFGSPIPHSVSAKRVLYMEQSNVLGNASMLLDKFVFTLPIISPLLLAGFFLGLVFCTRMPAPRTLALWTVLYLAVFTLSGTKLHGWYLAPPLLGYTAISILGWFSVAAWLSNAGLRRNLRPPPSARAWAMLGVVIAVSMGGSLGLKLNRDKVRVGQAYEEQVRKRIGLWLSENVPPHATVALEPIGYVGYFSQRRIMDTAGLISPEVTALYRGGLEPGSVDLYLTLRPDYVVLRDREAGNDDARFLKQFHLVASFESAWRDTNPEVFTGFNIYRRLAES